MSAPFIWVIVPFFISIALIFFRKNYQIAALVQTVTCILLVLILLVVHFGEFDTGQAVSINLSGTFNLLGRTLEFTNSDKFVIGIFYTVLAAWSAVLMIQNKHSKIVPLGLSLTSLLLAAIAVEPFLYSALLVEVTVIIGSMIVVDLRTGRSKGIIRALIFFTLGMPFILLAGWYLAGGETSPVNDTQLVQATVLLGFGFVFWLGIFPFHSWIPLVAEESDVADGLYILAILPFAIFIILLKYLNGFVWLRDYALVYQALLLIGLAMTVTGAIWATFQTNIKKLTGYLVITYSGLLLIALGLNTNQGFQIFSELLLPRFLSIFLLMISFLAVEKKDEIRKISDLDSLFYRFPIASLSMLTAFFSVTGMPLTVGFLPVQSLYQAAAKSSTLITGLIITSIALLSISFLRIFMVIMQPLADEFDTVTILDDLKENKFLAAAIVIVLLAGLIPNILFPSFNQILNSFEFLVR
jgi:formate hydrogenlyase subunit 3/multisubunit Na+/H+ antiporter MnhD subunit